MTRILFDGFDVPPNTSSLGVDISDDFAIAALLLALPNPAALQIAPDITGDFGATVSVVVGLIYIAADVTADFSAAIAAGGVLFIPPDPDDPRVAVITHST